MSTERVPGGISSVEFEVFVKDPAATAGLFSYYVLIPGVGQVTMPIEEAPSTDEVTLEGVGQATGFAGAGTITCSLPRLTQHPAHRMLMNKQTSGDTVLVKLYRRATLVNTYSLDSGSMEAAAKGESSLKGGSGVAEFSAARLGHYASVATALGGTTYATASEIYEASDTPATGNDQYWRAVVDVDAGFLDIVVAPGYDTPLAKGSAGAPVNVRLVNPGMQFTDVSCRIGTMARGEASGSASVTGNLVFRPDTALGTPDIVMSTASLGTRH